MPTKQEHGTKLSHLAQQILNRYRAETKGQTKYLSGNMQRAILSHAAMMVMSARVGDDLPKESTARYIKAMNELTYMLG